MKEFDVVMSARVTFEGTVTVMDVEGRDEALRLAEIALAKSIGKEVSELQGVDIDRCIYVDPGEAADYANNWQKTLRGV